MKKIIFTKLFLFSFSLAQTCDGMFAIYDSCYDANNCDEAYDAVYNLSTSGGLSKSVSEKLAKICKSSCENKKSNVKKLSKEDFQSVFCPNVNKK
ncbi:MAG TPA: hypothetical protein ENO34_01575 [Sulfurihydrogenibium azorense]|uniref:Lipoprotein n=1 Tax=Sulfurihydrogenibium azorense TaxID=309806 RepID=A0A831YBX6_9AQUI|nr:MAG: hypothetical protein C0178_03940 [Sulfurihydrogenibium sp.]HEV09071.1 hypothetical protein [Sulfurihydrogenibium azorense]